jgi:hypothetical protein
MGIKLEDAAHGASKKFIFTISKTRPKRKGACCDNPLSRKLGGD